MWKPKLSRLAVVMLASAALSSAQPSPDNSELPPGPGQAKARAGCTTCHDAHIIVQQRLVKTAWEKEVDKMIKWGSTVSPSDREVLVDYFSANFGPDKPPYVAKRSERLTSPHPDSKQASAGVHSPAPPRQP